MITGVGSGVGAATALTLASKGYEVVGLDIKFNDVIIKYYTYKKIML